MSSTASTQVDLVPTLGVLLIGVVLGAVYVFISVRVTTMKLIHRSRIVQVPRNHLFANLLLCAYDETMTLFFRDFLLNRIIDLETVQNIPRRYPLSEIVGEPNRPLM